MQLTRFTSCRETTRLTIRMLTARAAGLVLQNISEVDQFQALWIKEHFKQNPPIEGNTFLQGLLETKPVCAKDPYGTTHYINPAQIANAVLLTREVLAQKLTKTLGPRVQDANMAVMRGHLETHTYVSGTLNETKSSFKQYRKGQQQSPQQWQQPN
eukprot:GHRR01029856.1.p1 GENE.GHRR01029856.1~~GHRR01029856.1.p1  ORF type:complete len:156 (-),score=46.39 GHRR01029856.1:494-961(-)